jgi:hypothetical protein
MRRDAGAPPAYKSKSYRLKSVESHPSTNSGQAFSKTAKGGAPAGFQFAGEGARATLHNFKVKGGGQECPPHTGSVRALTGETPVAPALMAAVDRRRSRTSG